MSKREELHIMRVNRILVDPKLKEVDCNGREASSWESAPQSDSSGEEAVWVEFPPYQRNMKGMNMV